MLRKKMLAITSLLTTLGLALAGCAGPSADGGSTATTAPAPETTQTIKIWSYVQEEDADWLAPGIDAMKVDYPNFAVEYTFFPYDEITNKVLGTAVGGNAPDAIFYNPADAVSLSRSGLLADMSPYWSEFADSDQISEAVQWFNGDELVSLQGFVNTTALYYNADILNELGIKPPTTVDELDMALSAAYNAGYGGMTMCATPTAESEFQIFPWMLGEGQNYGSFDEGSIASVFSRFTDWISKGYIPADIVGWTQADAWQQFSGGRYAFTQNGNWQLGLASELPFEWAVVPIPAGVDGGYSIGGGEGFSLLEGSDANALTWLFFEKAILSAEGQLMMLEQRGNIPTRADASESAAISSDPSLVVFSDVVANMGTRPASPTIGEYLISMGRIWNSVAGGVLSPEEGAEEVVNKLNDIE